MHRSNFFFPFLRFRPFASSPFRLFALYLLWLFLLSPSVFAQTPTPQLAPSPVAFDFYSRGPYREDIPRPSRILGYEPGEFHTNYANFERLLREYAAKSDRLKVIEREQTPERRPMYLLILSSPENLARLDQIKANLAKLADPRTLTSQAEAETLIKETPIVVWLSYTIHGNESAGFEAAMQVLYQLIASNESKLLEVLKNTVVVMNPLQNPDGHERFATWYNATGIGRPERFAYEHREPWSIYGRLNHYYFDLNRDLVASSQIESQSAMKAFLEWHPQVSADHHGQPTNFFFPPVALPINPNLPKETAQKWLDIFGRANSAAFDRYGWNYYVRDVFDLFYPGYWDSWPSLNGATGMTYETDGGGWKGLNWKRDDDTIVTFRDGIAKHFTASLTTIETASGNREARLRDYLTFFQGAMEESTKGKIHQFVLIPGKDPGNTAKLVANLLRHGIEVQQASEKFSVKGAHDYFGGTSATREFAAGSYVITLNQPQSRLAKALLEPESPQDPEFVKRQNEKRERNDRRGTNAPKDDPDFYDITAWTLPLAYGVEAYWTEETAAVKGDFVVKVDPTQLTLSPQAKGASTTRTVPIVAGATALARASMAYVFTPETEAGERLALQLLKEGYKVATAVRPLRAGVKDYARGAFIVRTERNPESLHARLATLAVEYGVLVDSVNTAYPDTGITGVGSEAVVTLKPPKVAIIADDGVSQTSYGPLWFLLSKDFGVEFVPISIDTFKGVRMADFNVLILPDGGSGNYKERFGKDGIEKLKNWCNDGGTLICLGGAAAFATDKEVSLTEARLVGEDDDEKSGEGAEETPAPSQPAAVTAAMGVSTKEPKKKPAESEAKKQEKPKDGKKDDKKEEKKEEVKSRKPKKPLSVPGSIFRAKVNREHFLTFGYEQDELPVLVNSSNFFKLSKSGTNVLTFEAEKMRLSGFIWEKNTEELLRKTAYVVEEQTGDGHVILYATDPNFRYIWHASTRLFLNGLIYAPTVSGFSTGIR